MDDRPVKPPIRAMIVGAQKAGTTSWLRYLAQHPGIGVPTTPEIGFFINDSEYIQGYGRAFARYFSASAAAQPLLLAKSAWMMCSLPAMERLRQHNPAVHVLVSLRHPVERAYSAYWYARRRGWEDLESFEAAVQANPGRLTNDPSRQRNCAYLDSSTYVKHLANLWACFGRGQVHVFLLEELQEDARRVCQQVFALFPELDATFVPEVGRHHNPPAMHHSRILAHLLSTRSALPGWKRLARRWLSRTLLDKARHTLRQINEKEFTPPPLRPETRAWLLDYFRPFNAQLAELLSRDLSNWDR
ncbi:MAG: sulfotransferase domain-containing protein [Chloroflexota bacterium]